MGRGTSTLSRPERLAFLERTAPSVPLSAQADLLTVSRASLYYQPAAPSAEELALKRRIDKIYTAWPFYGSRRICQRLRREGRSINRKSVQRQMQEMGLAALGPKPNTSRACCDHAVYPYLLRDLRSGWPDHVWGIDITPIKPHLHPPATRLAVPGGRAGLVQPLRCGLGTRPDAGYVVAWELDQTLEMPFVLSALDRALLGATPGICNSDHGSHFTSASY
jgi:putative transposase